MDDEIMEGIKNQTLKISDMLVLVDWFLGGVERTKIGDRYAALSKAVIEKLSKGEGAIKAKKLALFEAIDGFAISRLTSQQKEDAEKFFAVGLVSPDQKEHVDSILGGELRDESWQELLFAGETLESTAEEMLSLKEKLETHSCENITLGELYVLVKPERDAA